MSDSTEFGPSVVETMVYVGEAHEGQTDKGGHPYRMHLYRVGMKAAVLLDRANAIRPLSPLLVYEIETIALLHDILEDTPTTADDLLGRGYPESVVLGVLRLTGRPEGVSYIDNIQALAIERNLPTIIVKAADNEDNADPARIAQLPVEGRSIVQRYHRSLKLLVPAYEALTGAEYPLPVGRALKDTHASV